VGELLDVGVLLGHHLDFVQPEVLTDLEDGLLVAAGRGRHPGNEWLLRVGVVALGDVVVRVVAGCAVALVEGDVGHVRERNSTPDEVVLDHLRGRHDDRRFLPHRRAVVRTHVAREDDDFLSRYLERFSVKIRVLLDEWFRRREHQRFAADLLESPRRHEQADRRLPESRRETDERVVVCGRAREFQLIESALEELGLEQRVLDRRDLLVRRCHYRPFIAAANKGSRTGVKVVPRVRRQCHRAAAGRRYKPAGGIERVW